MRALLYLLGLGLVGAIAYFAYLGRQERLKGEARGRLAGQGNGAQDMQKCAKCGAYVPHNAERGCERTDCAVGLKLPRSGS
ncbi:MAG TPA: hypothetical protein DCL48_03475 [Alphaproteobacteria bacterium]|nr:hypothetical protein [Alphaproteobacteria bacterium]